MKFCPISSIFVLFRFVFCKDIRLYLCLIFEIVIHATFLLIEVVGPYAVFSMGAANPGSMMPLQQQQQQHGSQTAFGNMQQNMQNLQSNMVPLQNTPQNHPNFQQQRPQNQQ